MIPKSQFLAMVGGFIFIAFASFMNAFFRPGKEYAALKKPSWTPPAGVFKQVWLILYIFMGVTLFFLWHEEPSPSRTLALIFFHLQLLFNALWSFLFFGLKKKGWAFVNMMALLVCLGAVIFFSYGINGGVAGLMTFYFLWICVASYLNWSIWKMNPS